MTQEEQEPLTQSEAEEIREELDAPEAEEDAVEDGDSDPEPVEE